VAFWSVSFVVIIGIGLPTSIGSVLTLPYFPHPARWSLREKLLVGETPNPGKTRRKGVRPMAERKRKIPLFFYVTEDELALIQEKMKLLGTENKSAYLRKMALDGYIINVDYTDIKANTAQLQRIGSNINQILKRMNQTGNLYAADVADIKGALEKIWHTQKSILSSQRLTKR